MSFPLLILGAGYTGKVLARQAREESRSVFATTSNQESQAYLEDLGVQVFDFDVLNPGGELPLPPDFEGDLDVVYSVPTLFRDYDEAPSGELARHVEPLAEVLGLLKTRAELRVRTFLYFSSTSVYGDHHGKVITEESTRHPTAPFGKMRRDIEDFLLQEEEIPTAIGRIVGIYGPDRTLEKRIQDPSFRLVDGGSKVTNRIHVEDLARAILFLLEKKAPERVYNLSDGAPLTVKALVDFVVKAQGLTPPEEESLQEYGDRKKDPNLLARWKSSALISNDRLKRLGFSFQYPDAMKGYEALFKDS